MTSRSELHRALNAGQVTRLPRGRVTLPGVDQARAVAAAFGGTVSHLSAAQHWGWKVKYAGGPAVRHRAARASGRPGSHAFDAAGSPPGLRRPAGLGGPGWGHVTGAHGHRLRPAAAVRRGAQRRRLGAAEPPDDRWPSCRAAAASPRTGRASALRVAREASGLADNPFESVLRAIALDVPGLHVRPQGWIGRVGRVDLVDARLLIAIEADSFEHHASPEALSLRRTPLHRLCPPRLGRGPVPVGAGDAPASTRPRRPGRGRGCPVAAARCHQPRQFARRRPRMSVPDARRVPELP